MLTYPDRFVVDHPYKSYLAWDNPPVNLFQLEPDHDDPLKRVPVPSLCDENGDPCISPRYKDKELRYFSFLPFRIPHNIDSLTLEFWCRLDIRLEPSDILERMIETVKFRAVKSNALSMRRQRLRKAANARARHGGRVTPTSVELEGLHFISSKQLLLNTSMVVHHNTLWIPRLKEEGMSVGSIIIDYIDSGLPVSYFLENMPHIPSPRISMAICLRKRLQQIAIHRGFGSESINWLQLGKEDQPTSWNDRGERYLPSATEKEKIDLKRKRDTDLKGNQRPAEEIDGLTTDEWLHMLCSRYNIQDTKGTGTPNAHRNFQPSAPRITMAQSSNAPRNPWISNARLVRERARDRDRANEAARAKGTSSPSAKRRHAATLSDDGSEAMELDGDESEADRVADLEGGLFMPDTIGYEPVFHGSDGMSPPGERRLARTPGPSTRYLNSKAPKKNAAHKPQPEIIDLITPKKPLQPGSALSARSRYNVLPPPFRPDTSNLQALASAALRTQDRFAISHVQTRQVSEQAQDLLTSLRLAGTFDESMEQQWAQESQEFANPEASLSRLFAASPVCMKAFDAAVAELNLNEGSPLTPEIRDAISKQVVVKLTERDRFRVMIANHEPVVRTSWLQVEEGYMYPIVEADAVRALAGRFERAKLSRELRRYRSSAF